MKTPLEVLHKYFHHFKSERTRDLVVKAMEDYATIYHDNEVKKLNIPAVIKSVCEKCEELQAELDRCYEAMDAKKGING